MNRFKLLKKYNKIASAICLATIMFTTQKCIIASAADYTDQAWQYEVGGDSNDIFYTPSRYKSTDTSVYCKVESFTSNRKSGDVLRAIIVDGNKNEFSTSYMKTMDRIGQYEIYNMAYEDTGGCNVRIKFWSRDWRPFYTWGANGQWSPDCYGNFN